MTDEAATVHGAVTAGRPKGAATRVRLDDLQLGRHHFHWLRALLEGLPAGPTWNRYLAFEGRAFSKRLHPTRLGKLLGRIARAAERRSLDASLALHRKRFRDAVFDDVAEGVVALEEDPGAATGFPSLDEWIEMEVHLQRQTNPDFDRDFYSEREWLEAFEDAWGEERQSVTGSSGQCESAPSSLTGSQLYAPDLELADGIDLRKQLDALNNLERALIRAPLPIDPATAWLRSNMALRLRGAGVHTLEHLVAFVNRHGFNWHSRVPGIGPQLAGHIVDWLEPWAQAWQTPMQTHALLPPPILKLRQATALAEVDMPATFGLVPLERLAVPPPLDGSQGRFRHRGDNAFGARNDLEAISGWLNRYRERPKTFTSYGRIAERFYLWCLNERRVALSDIMETDVLAHREFLSAPPERWVGRHGVERSSAEWRPLRGALDPVSQRHTFVVLSGMFRALVEAGYLSINPADGVVPRMRLPSPRVNVSRRFTSDQWDILMSALAAAKDTPFTRRTKLVLLLGSTTGLRLSELALARIKDIRVETVDGEPEYILSVLGKGHKTRDVPISGEAKELIEAHHRDMESVKTNLAPDKPIRTKDNVAPAAALEYAEMRPLIGALKLPPTRWKEDAAGAYELDKVGRGPADRYGQLDAGALYESLKRAFKSALRHADATGQSLAPADRRAFLEASTHWLRHFFATSFISEYGMDLGSAMLMLGHASLNTTSMYVNPELKTLVRAKRAAVRKRNEQKGC